MVSRDLSKAAGGVVLPAHTPGPWQLEQPETWPFDLMVIGPDGEEVIGARRWAHASGQRSVADCMSAEGFDHQARPPIIETLAQQVATLRLIAAAPDLLEALATMVTVLGNPDGLEFDKVQPAYDAARAAISKALGTSAHDISERQPQIPGSAQ